MFTSLLKDMHVINSRKFMNKPGKGEKTHPVLMFVSQWCSLIYNLIIKTVMVNFKSLCVTNIL